MGNDDLYILVRIKRRIAFLISALLRGASAEPHFEASKLKADCDSARELRQQGDDIHEVAKAIEAEMNRHE